MSGERQHGRVTVTEQDGVALVTIDNQPLNALSVELVSQIEACFDLIACGTSRAVVITGAGERSFVAGADIAQFPALLYDSGMAFVQQGQRVYRKIEQFDRPVICAVNGFALGGGLELALACDIRVAAENAKFGLPEATLGICPGYGGTQRLPRLVGIGMAKKLMFTGELISAQEAYHIGLCEVLVKKGEALGEAFRLARRIADAAAPMAVRLIKRVIAEGAQLDLLHAIELEAQAFGQLCLTQDKNEGINAFFEKRPPAFQGN